MALAYRSAMGTAEQLRIALGEGPAAESFPPEVLEREAEDLAALEALGVGAIALCEEAYPARLRGEGAPLLLWTAGRESLLTAEEGVEILAGPRGVLGARLMELLDSGGRAIVVLSKGMLKAKTMLRALAEPIEDGSILLLSAEPPRAAWGPLRDERRDRIAAELRKQTPRG